MPHSQLRPGNLVRYIGSLNDYRNHIGEIISIDEINKEDAFLLRVKNWKKEDQQIRAYKNDIWAVNVDLEHLNKIGFSKDPDRNVFSFKGINVIRPVFIGVNANGHSFVDKGFVVVEKQIPVPPTEEQIKDSCVSIAGLHGLQNYLYDKLDFKVDADLFL